jgi:gibberellin A4 carboxyl methyltransferase
MRFNAIGQVSDDARAVFAAQADRDLQAFLHARAAELVGGGKLLVEVFGAGDELRTCDGIYDALNDAVLEVLAAGSIDRDAYESFYQPVYFRTLDELTAPFARGDSPFAKLFRLDRAACYEVPVPIVEAFRNRGDAENYAREFTDFFRAFTEAVLRSSFAGHPSLDRLIDDIYTRAERLVRDDPARYEFHYVSVAMLPTRQE